MLAKPIIFTLLMFAAISGFIFSGQRAAKPMHLTTSFKEQRTVSYDIWNKISDGDVHLEYLDSNDKVVGDISFRVFSGQIGWLRFDTEYRNRGLEEQMLVKATDEMRKANVPAVWEVATKNNDFWSKIKGATYNDPVQQSVGGMRRVTGMGYLLPIDKKPILANSS